MLYLLHTKIYLLTIQKIENEEIDNYQRQNFHDVFSKIELLLIGIKIQKLRTK